MKKEETKMCKKVRVKGITLIALIITIIVMLILVGVTLSVALNGGLISKAQEAKTKTEEAQIAERDLLTGRIKVGDTWYDSFDEYLKDNPSEDQNDEPPKWGQDENGNITYEGEISQVKIGDFIEYDSPTNYEDPDSSGKKKGWRVLGVENGNLLIMADSQVDRITLSGGAGEWTEGVAKLDETCKKYVDNKYAKDARSIRVEDINKITGYSPLCEGVRNPTEEQKASGSKFGKDKPYEYGNTVKYTLKDGYVYYQYGTKAETKSTYNKFTSIDGTKLVTEEEYNAAEDKTGIAKEIEIKSDYYTYYPHSLSTDSTKSKSNPGILDTSAEYDMIFNKYDGIKDGYWLASPCVSMHEGYVNWCMRVVDSIGNVNVSYGMFYSNGAKPGAAYGIRPVVTLSSKVKLGEGKDVDGKPEVKTYSISIEE